MTTHETDLLILGRLMERCLQPPNNAGALMAGGLILVLDGGLGDLTVSEADAVQRAIQEDA